MSERTQAVRELCCKAFPGSIVLLLGVVVGALAAAAEPDAVGDCASAEARVRADSESVPHLRELAACRMQGQNFGAALAALEKARALRPLDPELALELAIALYHAGQPERSEQALQFAEAHLPERADLLLYRGMLAHGSGDYRVATSALERARRLDPAGVEPVASYYAGLGFEALGRNARAGEALSRVAHDWPGTFWATESERALDRLRGNWVLPHWLRLQVGAEYDDNVVLRANRVQSPPGFGGEADWRGVWSASAGVEALRLGSLRGGVAGSYDAGIHDDLGDFDWHQPGLTLWLDHPLLWNLQLRLQYDFAHAWLDEDPYLSSHDIGITLFRDWGSAGRSRLLTDGYVHEFHFSPDAVPDGSGPTGSACPGGVTLCGPPGIEEDRERDRDGGGFRLEAEHALNLLAGVELRLGYGYEWFNARGREYSLDAHSFRAGLRVPLVANLTADARTSYAIESYRGASSYPNPSAVVTGQQYALPGNDRGDDVFRAGLDLEWPLGLGLTAVGYWSFTDQDSNVPVFNYHRHVGGLLLRWDHLE